MKRAELPVVVLLSPGVKMRVGPHRLYNRITRELCDLGFTVFKFDFAGLGDSEGELDRELLAQVYNDTENGAFVADSEDALDWLEKNYRQSKFIVGGLCGGAITGILLGSRDSRVQGLISLGMTTTLAMGEARTRFATQAELASLRRGYVHRLFNIKSWLRLLTFQSDYRTIARAVGQLFRRRKSAPPSESQGTPGQKADAASNANPLFPPAFFAMTSKKKPILLIFSGADRLYWDFDEKFAQPFSSQLSDVRDLYELHIVENANHVFSLREWEQKMLELTCNWLETNFGSLNRSSGK